ncbi:MAG: hypothetical protein CYG60_13610 [Actinobacteria bacterium]|nr:MAG: hypothetical protein CYG60_13610 [Actinomycetota bacterium]
MSLDGYELFDKKAVPSTSKPWVTLQKGGLLSINTMAYQKIGSPEAVEVLYNKAERKIALRPAPMDSPRAFPVRKQGGRENIRPSNLVSLTAFCNYHGIETNSARRYRPEFTDDGVLIVDLAQEAADATGPRAKSAARA